MNVSREMNIKEALNNAFFFCESRTVTVTYLGGTIRLKDSPTLLRSLSVTNFDLRFVTFPDGVTDGLLTERDLALLLKVLLALLLLTGAELGDVGVVTLLDVVVDTF